MPKLLSAGLLFSTPPKPLGIFISLIFFIKRQRFAAASLCRLNTIIPKNNQKIVLNKGLER